MLVDSTFSVDTLLNSTIIQDCYNLDWVTEIDSFEEYCEWILSTLTPDVITMVLSNPTTDYHTILDLVY